MRLKAELNPEDVSNLMRKLRKLPEAVRDPIRVAIETSAIVIRNDARASMPPSRDGVTRTVYHDGIKVTHTASAPGAPPAVDTGALVKSVAYAMESDGLGADIGTNMLHGLFLELHPPPGVAARPWLFPAFERNKRKSVARIAKAVNVVLKGAGGL